MWLTATRTLVVGHLRITDTTHLTAQQLDISSASRAARALREAGAGASHSAPQQQQQQQLDPEDFRRCRQAKPGVAVPRLAPVRQWRSGRERPAESVTLVTQLSLERCGCACGTAPRMGCATSQGSGGRHAADVLLRLETNMLEN